MKALGLDLGSKSLGIAISDAFRILARGVENYTFESNDYPMAVNKVIDWVNKEPIDTIVLGLPKNMDGTIGFQGQVSEQFKTLLAEKTACHIVLWDERLTSKMASAQMIESNLRKKKRKKTLDQEAAVIILQSYLDAKK